MNSCVLMAQVKSEPELRYTQDNTPLAQMLVEFPALRDGDPPCRMKAVGWGNLGQEIQQTYHEGDQVILVGRLSMNTIDRPEGFKEKKVEFVISQIQAVGGAMGTMPSYTPSPTPSYSAPRATTPAPVMSAPNNVVPINTAYQPSEPSFAPEPDLPETNLDDIPF